MSDRPQMEGVLWKWTNYLSGWQPRWFVLDNGVLAYYKSQEEVHQGSKGALKMSVCEIAVHPTDQSRFDLIIPHEQHFYVKAATPAERQTWVVALGTAKACLADSRNRKEQGLEESKETLKGKMSELRLYCDLLLQQVSNIKTAAEDPEQVDQEMLHESSSLLSATCDTFIRTMNECMKLADNSFTPQIPNTSMNSALPPTPTRHAKRPYNRSTSVSEHRHSPTPVSIPKGPTTTYKNLEDFASTRRPPADNERLSASAPTSPMVTDVPNNLPRPPTLETISPSNVVEKDDDDDEERKVKTFFTAVEHSFTDVRLTVNGDIPTGPFLDACNDMLPFFDHVGGPAMAPVKMDVQGNIRKLTQKYSTNPGVYCTLQDIVKQEMAMNATQVKNSATDAIMWLKRGLQFSRELFIEIVQGERDLTVAVGNAYEKTLKKYHGFVVRGVVALAIKAVPSYEDFQTKVTSAAGDEYKGTPVVEKALMQDAETYADALGVLTTILHEFYVTHNLDSQEVVG
ncbi:PLEKHA8 [Branchiostoma lanceolatum]|uniref:Pleckstrin homology domain-containing family A member 8 n=1 Tax=Branchiostoma lanceolatum TaxID=7740 RepID=A0A8J9Z867_BRALA|nr:PLEKHA8 [Branchiostoma lanceolatum]